MKTNIGQIIATVSLLLVYVLILNQVEKTFEARHWVLHTHEVIKMNDNLTISLLKMETNKRAYMLTRDQTFLVDFEIYANQTGDHIDSVKKLTVDNPTQQKNVAEANTQIKNKINHYRDTLSAFSKTGMSGIKQDFAQDRKTDDVGKALKAIEAEEGYLLTIRQDTLRATTKTLRWCLHLTVLASLCPIISSLITQVIAVFWKKRNSISA